MVSFPAQKSRVRMAAAGIAVIAALAGCADTTRQSYTSAEAAVAVVPGFSSLRMYLDAPMLPKNVNSWTPLTTRPEKNFLVMSGGGAGGAFGVGVLSSWTKKGTRPSFDMVTGVSTGALIAPFAFLGPQYDDRLVALYTSGVARSLMQLRPLPAGLLGQSMAKAEPLRHMVEENVTPAMLAAIAAEHRKGRRLLVLTTNLDSQRAVVWNMGAIADSGRPDALRLFRSVLIASASIPGVYPAVMIDAEANGKPIKEMHSDGGTASQFLAVPDSLMISGAMPAKIPTGPGSHIYVIINNALIPEFAMMQDRTLSVISRAYATLVKSQTRSALQALYGFSQRTRTAFHVAVIDAVVPYDTSDPFGTDYMRAVFNLGAAEMEAGSAWKTRPLFSGPALAATQTAVARMPEPGKTE